MRKPPAIDTAHPAAVRTVIRRKRGRDKLKELLGENLIGIRKRGDEVEILTKGPIPPGLLLQLQEAWERSEK